MYGPYEAIQQRYDRDDAEIEQLRADRAAAMIEIASQRQYYADLISSTILETGVDVPVGGMTIYEAIRALRADLASSQTECARLREIISEAWDNCEQCRGLTVGKMRCARCQTFLAALAAQPNGTTTHCEWKHGEDDSDAWETACGEMFCLNTGTPKENKVCFCPYCGKPLSEAARPNDAKQADRDSAKSA